MPLIHHTILHLQYLFIFKWNKNVSKGPQTDQSIGKQPKAINWSSTHRDNPTPRSERQITPNQNVYQFNKNSRHTKL